MSVSAVIVTRGDCDLEPVLASLPPAWPRLIWDNSSRSGDRSVFGRYAGLGHVATSLVYVQDDDVIVSDPQAVVDAWRPGHVVCNMPAEFRHAFYEEHALVGFGACFERALPERAFARFAAALTPSAAPEWWVRPEIFHRCCDIVFTALTPRILVDVPKEDREFASAPGRMWTTPGHQEERARMLALALQARDSPNERST